MYKPRRRRISDIHHDVQCPSLDGGHTTMHTLYLPGEAALAEHKQAGSGSKCEREA